MLALLDEGRLDLRSGGRFLHVAPSERHVAARMRERGEYVAVDLQPRTYGGAEVRALDLRDLWRRSEEFGTFDLVYASHVLEHIVDDRAALTAVRQSLADRGGELWALVPLADGATDDGDGSETVRERERRFGQWDHVRQYGEDFGDRLVDGGFSVQRFDIDVFPASTAVRFGLSEDDVLWRCQTT